MEGDRTAAILTRPPSPAVDPGTVREQYRDERNLRARASIHDRFGTNPEGWFRWLGARMRIADGERVLEVGSGPGWLWARGTRAPPGVVLTDLSVGMVSEARRSLHESPGIRFLACDAQALPFPDARFDVAVANHMLYHVGDRPLALRELSRVLVRGGRLFASTVGASHMREIDELAREIAPRERWLLAEPGQFTLESGRAELEVVFDGVRLERYEDRLRVTEVEPVLDYLRSMGPSALDPARLRRVRAKVARHIDANGAFEVTKAIGLFSARRR